MSGHSYAPRDRERFGRHTVRAGIHTPRLRCLATGACADEPRKRDTEIIKSNQTVVKLLDPGRRRGWGWSCRRPSTLAPSARSALAGSAGAVARWHSALFVFPSNYTPTCSGDAFGSGRNLRARPASGREVAPCVGRRTSAMTWQAASVFDALTGTRSVTYGSS